MIGIYKITFPNNKVYIGQSVNIERRKQEHYRDAFKENRDEYKLPIGSAIRKYFPNIKFEVLEETEVEELTEKEEYYIELYHATDRDCGYNILKGDIHSTGEKNIRAVFTNDEVYDIRKRRFNNERKCEVYKDYYNRSFNSFENVWLGNGYPNVGKEFLISPYSKTRAEYSSIANSGENNNKAKLTKKDVLNIRYLHEKENQSASEIHKLYPFVNIITIKRVINYETWKNI